MFLSRNNDIINSLSLQRANPQLTETAPAPLTSKQLLIRAPAASDMLSAHYISMMACTKPSRIGIDCMPKHHS